MINLIVFILREFDHVLFRASGVELLCVVMLGQSTIYVVCISPSQMIHILVFLPSFDLDEIR